MEKINTPLMVNAERIEAQIKVLEERRKQLDENGGSTSDSRHAITIRIDILRDELVQTKKLLPTERDVIVKTYSAGQDNYRQFTLDRLNNRLTYDEQYFTQTFKSYE